MYADNQVCRLPLTIILIGLEGVKHLSIGHCKKAGVFLRQNGKITFISK